ncbi:MAG: YetF domain-containing protein [Frankiaceae bacterium]
MLRLGVTWDQALSVVLSTIGIYLTFLLLLRLVGQRALANMSSFDFAAAIALGAVMGRVVLGYTPTLLAGVIGLGTLFALQGAVGLLRRNPRADALLSNRALLLMADGQLLQDNLRKAHIIENELRAKLRAAGIRRYDDVACVILERTGSISVLHRGETISPTLLADVRGRELLPASIADTSEGQARG